MHQFDRFLKSINASLKLSGLCCIVIFNDIFQYFWFFIKCIIARWTILCTKILSFKSFIDLIFLDFFVTIACSLIIYCLVNWIILSRPSVFGIHSKLDLYYPFLIPFPSKSQLIACHLIFFFIPYFQKTALARSISNPTLFPLLSWNPIGTKVLSKPITTFLSFRKSSQLSFLGFHYLQKHNHYIIKTLIRSVISSLNFHYNHLLLRFYFQDSISNVFSKLQIMRYNNLCNS